jgi:hypothetical protein
VPMVVAFDDAALAVVVEAHDDAFHFESADCASRRPARESDSGLRCYLQLLTVSPPVR